MAKFSINNKRELRGHSWLSINKTVQHRCRHCGVIRTYKFGVGLVYSDTNTTTIPDCVEKIDNSEFYK